MRAAGIIKAIAIGSNYLGAVEWTPKNWMLTILCGAITVGTLLIRTLKLGDRKLSDQKLGKM